jgi:hypothetical protein
VTKLFKIGALKIFGSKRKNVTDLRVFLDGEFHDLCSSPNIIRIVKSRRVGLVGHTARMGKGQMCIQNLSENMKGRDLREDTFINERIIKWDFKK